MPMSSVVLPLASEAVEPDLLLLLLVVLLLVLVLARLLELLLEVVLLPLKPRSALQFPTLLS